MQWIVGDVHGAFHTLTKLLEKVRTADEVAKLVFVGDYVDRGRLNKEVVDLMISLQAQGAVCLRGNHDDIIDYLLNDHCYSHIREWVSGKVTPANVTRWWYQNGFAPTLDSYGVPDGNPDRVHAQFCENVPADHKAFFQRLELFWFNETHFACHGLFRHNEDLPRDFKFVKSERFEETLWGRYKDSEVGGLDLKTPVIWDKIGVFGHTPTWLYGSPTPIKFEKIRLIDTGGFKPWGYLTAYCCETDDWILQATDTRDVC